MSCLSFDGVLNYKSSAVTTSNCAVLSINYEILSTIIITYWGDISISMSLTFSILLDPTGFHRHFYFRILLTKPGAVCFHRLERAFCWVVLFCMVTSTN